MSELTSFAQKDAGLVFLLQCGSELVVSSSLGLGSCNPLSMSSDGISIDW